jgi:signal transduction histidine kinase
LQRRFAPATETAVFRIVQESVHNISRHAQARNVNIKLKADTNKLTAVIEDDGKGFDLNSYQSRVGVKSLGLLGIKERTTLLGGTFAIETHIGQGTRLKVEVPVDNKVPVDNNGNT